MAADIVFDVDGVMLPDSGGQVMFDVVMKDVIDGMIDGKCCTVSSILGHRK